MNAQDVINCVLKENIAMLIKIPGIGRKTAERLIIELRDRLKTFNDKSAPKLGGVMSLDDASPKDDAINALVALGYKPLDASKSVEKCYNIDHSSETLIKLALQNMVR